MILIVTSQLSASMKLVFEDLIQEHCAKYRLYLIDEPNVMPLAKVIQETPPTAAIALGRRAIAIAKETLQHLEIPKRALQYLPLEFVGITAALDVLMKKNSRRQTFIELLEEYRRPPQAPIDLLPPEAVFPPELLELNLDSLQATLQQFFAQGKPYVVLLPDDRQLAIVPEGVKPDGYDYVFTVGEALLLIEAHQLFRGRPLAIKDRSGAKLDLTVTE